MGNDILYQLNQGDKRAFELVFHRYYSSLCFFANKFVKDKDVAKDIVQEVFVRFYERKTHFENSISLKSFLYNCVQNESLNYLNRNKNTYRLQDSCIPPMEEEGKDSFYYQLESQFFNEVFVAIEELPQECRRIFKMSYIEHRSTKEIALELNIAETTIKTQRQRAKKYLQKRLDNLYPLLVFIFFRK